MKGQTQSGGHWNAALGLLVRGSDLRGSSGCWSESGEGSVTGILSIMVIPLRIKRWRTESLGLRHQRKQADDLNGPSVHSHLLNRSNLQAGLIWCLFKIAQFQESAKCVSGGRIKPIAGVAAPFSPAMPDECLE
jgi:hypothetical protein